MQSKYRLFQQVHCWLGKEGYGRATIAGIRSLYTTEFEYPMGKPVMRWSYDLMLEKVLVCDIPEDMIDLSRLRLEKRVKDATS